MADIELVVKIPEEMYNHIKNGGNIGASLLIENAIKNGTPLPKGHGRLIDADELKKYYPHDADWEYPVSTNEYVNETIDDAQTIIEADKGDKYAVSN